MPKKQTVKKASRKKPTKTFTIDRSKWLCGTNRKEMGGALSNDSLLRNNSGAMCCLGFYLASCGVKGLRGKGEPSDVFSKIPAEAYWLLYRDPNLAFFYTSDDGNRLIRINDSTTRQPKERELEISRIFAAHDIVVRFKGKYTKSPVKQ